MLPPSLNPHQKKNTFPAAARAPTAQSCQLVSKAGDLPVSPWRKRQDALNGTNISLED